MFSEYIAIINICMKPIPRTWPEDECTYIEDRGINSDYNIFNGNHLNREIIIQFNQLSMQIIQPLNGHHNYFTKSPV